MTDSKAVRELIQSKGLKLKYIAKQLGLSDYGFLKKLDNISEFRPSEINKLCEILDITSLKEKDRLFFKKKSD